MTRDVHCGTCVWCSKPAVLTLDDVTASKAEAFMRDRTQFGAVQREFPSLTVGQRETILSATHDKCFDQMFPDDD